MGLVKKAAERMRREQEEGTGGSWELGMHPPAPRIWGHAEFVPTEGWKS